MAMLHWPPQHIRHVPLADMAEAYKAFHQYNPKPDLATAPQPMPRTFLADMIARFPDVQKG